MKFKALPFIYELHKQPKNHDGIPNALPFELKLDDRYDLVKQAYSSVTDEYLTKAYKISSILAGNTTEDDAGDAYADSIIKFIHQNFGKELENINVLDIGCGTGYLLQKLKQLGCNVYGIEPGQQAKVGIEKYNIPIEIDFFPPKKLNLKFDLIISILVLEHIAEPEIFINDIKKYLNTDGTVIIGVPDEEPYLASGDISTLFHEHWNYFTKYSFKSFLENNGANNIVIQNSEYGGIIYSKFNLQNSFEVKDLKNIGTVGLEYIQKIEKSGLQLRSFFEKYSNQTIGIYVPGRVINSLLTENFNRENLRFFDDDKNSYGRYYPGFNNVIENFNDFKSKLPDVVLIMSSFFGHKIEEKIVLNTNMPKESIFLWKDFFNVSKI
jgi:2-polyprenyl-3-methyl-5-hydroxy-6-metoxy-1,4-benzoquinol methylase